MKYAHLALALSSIIRSIEVMGQAPTPIGRTVSEPSRAVSVLTCA
jgi:hypothetical protein